MDLYNESTNYRPRLRWLYPTSNKTKFDHIHETWPFSPLTLDLELTVFFLFLVSCLVSFLFSLLVVD